MKNLTKTIELTIETTNIKTFNAEFKKLEKLAKKLELDTPTFEFGEYHQELVNVYESKQKVDKYFIDVVDVKINIVDTFKFNGWSLFATIHHAENVVDLFDVNTNLPNGLGVDYTKCDYCNSNHNRRKISFVVVNEQNEFKQVGSTCVKKFLGYSPKSILALAARLTLIIDFGSNDVKEESIYNKPDYSSRVALNVKEVLGVAHEYLKSVDFKYVKKLYFDDEIDSMRTRKNRSLATSEIVINKMYDDEKAVIDEDYYNKLIAYANTLEYDENYDYSIGIEPNFEHKIGSLRNIEMIRQFEVWMPIFLIINYEKSIIVVEEDASEHIGVVGEKTVIECIVKDVVYGEGDYGMWTMYKLEDADGNQYTKFGVINEKFMIKGKLSNGGDIKKGSIIRATAMIKAHNEFKGIKTTLLGRLSKAK